MRLTGADGTFDARFPFPQPIRGHADLHRALHTLFETARKAATPGR